MTQLSMPLSRQIPIFFSRQSGASYAATVLGIEPASLVGYWPMYETTGTTVANLSAEGSARNGTYTGVTLDSVDGPAASMGRAGLWDGVNDFASLQTASLSAAFTFTSGTLSIWAQRASFTAAAWLAYIVGSGSNAIQLYHPVTGTMRFRLTAGGVTVERDFTTFSGTTWQHWVITWTPGVPLGLFRNAGAAGSPSSNAGTWNAASTSIVNIGAQNAASYYNGSLMHAALWNKVLSAAQITTLATAI
jgi:hypothetical protein